MWQFYCIVLQITSETIYSVYTSNICEYNGMFNTSELTMSGDHVCVQSRSLVGGGPETGCPTHGVDRHVCTDAIANEKQNLVVGCHLWHGKCRGGRTVVRI